MLRVLRSSFTKKINSRSYVEIKETLMSAMLDQGLAKRPREVFDCTCVSSYADYDVHKGGNWSAAWFDNHDCYEMAWDDVHSIDDSSNVEAQAKSLDHSTLSFEEKHKTLDATSEFYVCDSEVRTKNGVEKMCGKYCCNDHAYNSEWSWY